MPVGKPYARELVGIDASDDPDRFAKDAKVELLRASATKLLLKANQFDYVVIRMGPHHLMEESALREVRRVLKRNGRLLLIDKHRGNSFTFYPLLLWNWVVKGRSPFSEFIISRKEHVRLFDATPFTIETLEHPCVSGTGSTFMALLAKR